MHNRLCKSCQKEMTDLGKIGFRTGGMEGIASIFLGGMADANEKVLQLDVYRCDSCGLLEFFDKDLRLPKTKSR